MKRRNHFKEKQGKFGWYLITKGFYKGRVGYYFQDEFTKPDPDDEKNLLWFDGNKDDPQDQKHMTPCLEMFDDLSLAEGLGFCGLASYREMEKYDGPMQLNDLRRFREQESGICFRTKADNNGECKRLERELLR